jgi:hypothetical protein
MRRCITLDGEICRQNDFAGMFLHAFLQTLQMQFFRAYTIQWREPPHQHIVLAAVTLGLLHHQQIRRHLHHAQQALITFTGGA